MNLATALRIIKAAGAIHLCFTKRRADDETKVNRTSLDNPNC